MPNRSAILIAASEQSGGVRGTIRRPAPNNNNGGSESPPDHNRYEPSAHYRRLNDSTRFPSSAGGGIGGSLADDQMLHAPTVGSSSPSVASVDARSISGNGIDNIYRVSPFNLTHNFSRRGENLIILLYFFCSEKNKTSSFFVHNLTFLYYCMY